MFVSKVSTHNNGSFITRVKQFYRKKNAIIIHLLCHTDFLINCNSIFDVSRSDGKDFEYSSCLDVHLALGRTGWGTGVSNNVEKSFCWHLTYSLAVCLSPTGTFSESLAGMTQNACFVIKIPFRSMGNYR